jgi:cell division septum initiation protein DivIVA
MTIDIYGSGGDTFRTRLFGFDKSEVRACVRNLVHDQDEAQRQMERLTARLRALEESSEHAAVHDSIGIQVEKVLASAHKVAEEINQEAETTRKNILSDAQEEALRLRAEAENDAAALVSSATARMTELQSAIERMTARRDVLQSELDEIADALDALSRQMRTFGEHAVGTGAARKALAVAKA